MKKVIVDTDILSMFAKVDALSVLVEFFGSERIGMTPTIADESSVPLQCKTNPCISTREPA